MGEDRPGAGRPADSGVGGVARARVFRDARLSAGEYALLLSATFQANDRTLREEELQGFQAQVVEAVSKVGLGCEPRRGKRFVRRYIWPG